MTNTTPVLNREALRRTRQSVADVTLPFYMKGWTHCIAAHAVRAETGYFPSPQIAPSFRCPAPAAARYLGLDLVQQRSLFTSPYNRAQALAALDRLIARAPEPVPEPELVCA